MKPPAPHPTALDPSPRSWGRVVRARHWPVRLFWRDEGLGEGLGDGLAGLPAGLTLLPHGLGRTYGDGCLNDGGVLLLTRGLDRFIAFDAATGVLRCEAGVSLAEILRLVLPYGWFLPVTPGTMQVTVGGAIANDVHGKNHHRTGTLGRFVRAFELVRSDGRAVCTPTEHPELFCATIGGLGLTGLVTWAELQLVRIPSAFVDAETVKLRGLDEFFALQAEADRRFAYTVAWIDCLAAGSSLGRGHLLCGNHANVGERSEGLSGSGRRARVGAPRLRFPCDAPSWLLNPLSIRLFNTLYFHRQVRRVARARVRLGPFFYPLDVVSDWNRAYGRAGLFQYQCAVPPAAMREAIRALLEEIARSRQASFLAVLKTFGELTSPGMLSFPRPGATLSLDFANRGETTLALFRRLDAIVREAGGALYPAKDACMTGEQFRRQYPAWEEFARHVDPRFSSSFWRRVNAREGAGP
jgi:FAD/FMN-containing dehydrogenase